MRFSRGSFLGISCLLALTFIFAASSASAEADKPDFYRLRMGDMEIVALSDGHTFLSQSLFRGISAQEMRLFLEQASQPADGDIRTAVNAYLVRMGDRLILVDAGAAACFGSSLGQIRGNLEAAGYLPEAVDTVLLTHLHADHVCGLTDRAGAAVFPNATLWTAEEEADYWLSEEKAAPASEGMRAAFEMARAAVKPYAVNGRLKTFARGQELFPGVTSVSSAGHTPGHSGYLFASRGQNLLIWGDIVHNGAVQFARPDVSIAFDSDSAQAVTTRKKIFEQAARERFLVTGAHLPFPGVGYVRRTPEGGYQWFPILSDQEFPGGENAAEDAK
ncbi:MAG: MBL fold metallo-hydrolase [Zoogloeaceae bacterium]|jgi:glyoxylase-like metal-dependent hydrolase (beta-lactamase superfamily II)|nr:MBL fold metallo-hydrolase [Zoogloeaceae bacterium]